MDKYIRAANIWIFGNVPAFALLGTVHPTSFFMLYFGTVLLPMIFMAIVAIIELEFKDI